VPSIDLAREITERIDAAEFGWEADFRNLHPSPFGMSVYARSIERLFDAAWKQPPMIGGAVQAHTLPDAIDEKSYFRGRLMNVTEAKGWRIDADWTPGDYFPASFCFSNWFAIPGSTFWPCCFMKAPMARPKSFSVKLLAARNWSTSLAVSSVEDFFGR